MFRVVLFFFTFLFSTAALPAQVITPTVIDTLPFALRESSTLQHAGDTALWTNNDSGDSARIFLIDTLAQLQRIFRLHNTLAVDWEALTQDSAGNLFIGDFGNNANDRTNLRIYKISHDSLQHDSISNPETIYFSYADQTTYPPDSTHLDFDCEAMVYLDQHLHLFSKNRSSGFCRRYVLPDTACTISVAPRDSFPLPYWVTDAALSPSGKVIVLLNETNLWVFSNFPSDSFFAGQFDHFAFPAWSQKEGIAFLNDTVLYMTDERLFSFGHKLYRFTIPNYYNPLNVPETTTTTELMLDPTTSRDWIVLDAPLSFPSQGHWIVYDALGRTLTQGETTTNQFQIPASQFITGYYTIQLISAGQVATLKLLWP